jgi:hypothetical protein
LSLLDVKALPLDDLIAIWNAFNGAFLTYTRGEDAHAEFIKELKQACGFLREMCEYIGGSDDLLYTIDQVGHWADLNRDRESLFALAVNALNAVTHMLARPQFKIIPSEKLIFFEVPRKTFGEGIIAKFHGIEIDVEEAGKCYAAGRDTACVFHLMRVMEVGLRALAASLNDPKLDPKRNPSWDSILGKCGDELEKSVRDRSPEWRQDDVFYSTATANLRAVKDAWRNPTMHVEQNYNEETALDIWNAVRAFMRHLSLKLTA